MVILNNPTGCSLLESVYQQEKRQSPLNMGIQHFRDRQTDTHTYTSPLLAVQNSSIGDLVTDSVTDSLSQSLTFTFDTTE